MGSRAVVERFAWIEGLTHAFYQEGGAGEGTGDLIARNGNELASTC